MGKTKKIIAALTAIIITATSTSLMSVYADDGEVKKTDSISASNVGNNENSLQEYADDISTYMMTNSIAGDAFVHDDKVIVTYSAHEDKIKAHIKEKGIDESIVVYEKGHNVGAIIDDKTDAEKTNEEKTTDKNGVLQEYADDISTYMMTNSIAGDAFVHDGKIIITYSAHEDKIKVYVKEKGIDEDLVVYEQGHDMIETQPATTIAVTETKPVTTITMPVLDDPTIQTEVVTVTVMSVNGDDILVKPVDGSPELNSSDKFYLSSKKISDDIKPKVGMKLEITYNGNILETYPAQFGNVKKVVEVKDDTVKEDPTLLKGTKDMTLNDVMRLAELGDELDWADFRDYNGKDVGSGQYIWEYKLEDGYVLRVIGVTDKKPDYILLSHDDDKGIDIRTNDVKEYIASTATPVVTENEKVEATSPTSKSLIINDDINEYVEVIDAFMIQNKIDGDVSIHKIDGFDKVVVVCEKYDEHIKVKEYIESNGFDINKIHFGFTTSESGLNSPDKLMGDANCDGQVDLSDAVMIMQALANPNKYGIDGTAEHHLTEQGKLNGDVDGDGLTVGDAQSIQRKLLGLENVEAQSVESFLTANAGFLNEKGTYTLFFIRNGNYFSRAGGSADTHDEGTWTISGDTVVLTGKFGTNRLSFDDNALIYIAEGSDGFNDFNPKDGEKFNAVFE